MVKLFETLQTLLNMEMNIFQMKIFDKTRNSSCVKRHTARRVSSTPLPSLPGGGVPPSSPGWEGVLPSSLGRKGGGGRGGGL